MSLEYLFGLVLVYGFIGFVVVMLIWVISDR